MSDHRLWSGARVRSQGQECPDPLATSYSLHPPPRRRINSHVAPVARTARPAPPTCLQRPCPTLKTFNMRDHLLSLRWKKRPHRFCPAAESPVKKNKQKNPEITGQNRIILDSSRVFKAGPDSGRDCLRSKLPYWLVKMLESRNLSAAEALPGPSVRSSSLPGGKRESPPLTHESRSIFPAVPVTLGRPLWD